MRPPELCRHRTAFFGSPWQAPSTAGAVLAVRFDPPAIAHGGSEGSPSFTSIFSNGRPSWSDAVIASMVYMPVPTSLPAVETIARTWPPSFSRRGRGLGSIDRRVSWQSPCPSRSRHLHRAWGVELGAGSPNRTVSRRRRSTPTEIFWNTAYRYGREPWRDCAGEGRLDTIRKTMASSSMALSSAN